MRYIVAILLVIVLIPLLAGCARFPSTPPVTTIPPRTLVAECTVEGIINPQYYYFLALGADQTRTTGPVPVVTGPELGNGWAIIAPVRPDETPRQPPFFVEYHNGQFQQFRTDPTTNQAIPLGEPFRAEVRPDLKTLHVEIDLSLLDPFLSAFASPIVQLNWITMEDITIQPQNIGLAKEYDGIGPTGNSYLNGIPTTESWIRYNGQYGIQEETANDGTTAISDIDLTGWRVEIQIQQPTTP